jgi:cytosine/adenosine deaminase-related metal-dependent hydrolase
MLKLATRGSARLLGRDDIGSLAVGKAADIFLVDLNRIEFNGALADVASLLGTVGLKAAADYVLVNGQIVVEKGRLRNVDEGQLVSAAKPVLARFLSPSLPCVTSTRSIDG